MIRSILVPLDGSLLGERAIPLARLVAGVSGAELVLLRAILSDQTDEGDDVEAASRAVKESEEYLAKQAFGLGDGSRRVKPIVTVGDPASAILDFVNENDIDMVVMATHGRTGLGRWLLGSVADKVVRHSHKPVLLVRPDGPPKVSLSRIMVTLDGSEIAETALEEVVELAKMLDARVVAIRVVPPPPVLYESYAFSGYNTGWVDDLMVSEQETARSYIDGVVNRLHQLGIAAEGIVATGLVAEAILEEADKQKIELIAMATHGRSGIGRWALGSVAERVIAGTKIPLILFRPDKLPPVGEWSKDGKEQGSIIRRAAEGSLTDATALLQALSSSDPLRQTGATEEVQERMSLELGRLMLEFVVSGRWRGHQLPGAPAGSSSQKRYALALEPLLIPDSDAPDYERRLEIVMSGLSSTDPAVRRAAVYLLGQASATEMTMAAIRKELSDTSSRVVNEAARVIGEAKDPDSVSALIAALGSRPADTWEAVTDALVKVGPPAAPALIAALRDPREHIRWQVTKALALIKDSRAAPALAAELDDPNTGVRWLASEGLRRLPPEDAAPPVLRRLLSDELNPWLRQGASRVLTHLSGPLHKIVQPVVLSLREMTSYTSEAPLRAQEALEKLAKSAVSHDGKGSTANPVSKIA